MGRELNPKEIAYFTNLVMLFIDERLPHLTEDGEKIPPLTWRKRPQRRSRGEADGGDEHDF